MTYIFYCHDCGVTFKKTAKLRTIDTDYGKREGIKCPLCKGRAEAKGISLLTLTSNGEFNSVQSKDEILNLD